MKLMYEYYNVRVTEHVYRYKLQRCLIQNIIIAH